MGRHGPGHDYHFGTTPHDDEASQAMIDHIFPAVDVLTPNLAEAEALLGRKLVTVQDVEQSPRRLPWASTVLVKGGHTFPTTSPTVMTKQRRHCRT
jgi:hydroxymethylpyrimidine/phosphomethylpyrimidine kinase